MTTRDDEAVKLATLVSRMRAAQRDYFQRRKSQGDAHEFLVNAKQLERQVDAACDKILDGRDS